MFRLLKYAICAAVSILKKQRYQMLEESFLHILWFLFDVAVSDFSNSRNSKASDI